MWSIQHLVFPNTTMWHKIFGGDKISRILDFWKIAGTNFREFGFRTLLEALISRGSHVLYMKVTSQMVVFITLFTTNFIDVFTGFKLRGSMKIPSSRFTIAEIRSHENSMLHGSLSCHRTLVLSLLPILIK